MALLIKIVRHCSLIAVLVLIVIAFGETNGASILVDLKEPKVETATNKTDPITKHGGITEEKLDPRMLVALFILDMVDKNQHMVLIQCLVDPTTGPFIPAIMAVVLLRTLPVLMQKPTTPEHPTDQLMVQLLKVLFTALHTDLDLMAPLLMGQHPMASHLHLLMGQDLMASHLHLLMDRQDLMVSNLHQLMGQDLMALHLHLLMDRQDLTLDRLMATWILPMAVHLMALIRLLTATWVVQPMEQDRLTQDRFMVLLRNTATTWGPIMASLSHPMALVICSALMETTELLDMVPEVMVDTAELAAVMLLISVLLHLPTLLMVERFMDKTTICTTECPTEYTEVPVPIQMVRVTWETGILLVTAIMWHTKFLIHSHCSYLLLMKSKIVG
ncbi:hypothetical protein DAPPUDRAFT_301626 [Daphnia pulex]|uniref:Uncharacterized protein n=1 Tax=Daphnia pulex TaxID=6669 RepID=E9G9T4_DAPPU|nr:hypothetical protein DAPPUDRAFT_301626 [Daphnia pulex]|eukprot:EFX83827.1 hypothetical protein DAPPUDRAFT_301626 [Daphnia pulex]